MKLPSKMYIRQTFIYDSKILTTKYKLIVSFICALSQMYTYNIFSINIFNGMNVRHWCFKC